MTCVYRYVDSADKIIKYVGIVWGERRTLRQRVDEHAREKRFMGVNWIIEYIEEDIKTRTDAELFEAHYIALYGTNNYLNSAKSGWGLSNYLPNREGDWKVFDPSLNTESGQDTSLEAPIENIAERIFSETLKTKTHTDRRYIFQGTISINGKDKKKKEHNRKIRERLDFLLNDKLFGEQNNRAKFNGFGDIELFLPLIGRVKYRDYDKVFVFPEEKQEVAAQDVIKVLTAAFDEDKQIVLKTIAALS